MPDRLPVDDSVTVPPSVRNAAAAAEAAHKAAYGGDQPTASPAAAPPQPDVTATVTPAPQPEPAAPEPLDTTHTPTKDELRESEYARRYNAMKGRYDQQSQTIGTMQEQMGELGDELMRTQNELLRLRNGVPQAQTPRPQPVRLLTEQDEATYGPEIIDMVKRAAREAVAPDLTEVKNVVQQTTQRVSQTAAQTMYAALDDAVPEWRTINTNSRFKAWCGLRDVYSGQVRGRLLNAALQAADAPRVIAFFQGFLTEEQATGQIDQPAALETPAPAVPLREPAIPLTSLAAPGRAKPASGGSDPAGSSADKPVYTRAQISAFYAAVRRGDYVGRETEKDKTERSIFAAQNDGRVR